MKYLDDLLNNFRQELSDLKDINLKNLSLINYIFNRQEYFLSKSRFLLASLVDQEIKKFHDKLKQTDEYSRRLFGLTLP